MDSERAIERAPLVCCHTAGDQLMPALGCTMANRANQPPQHARAWEQHLVFRV